MNSNLRKRNVAVHIIPVTAYNQLSERIAYFCDGVSKEICYSVWIEEKAVNSYYSTFSAGRRYNNPTHRQTEHTCSVNTEAE